MIRISKVVAFALIGTQVLAADYVVPSGDVAKLVDALQTKLESYSRICLEPGIYDLSGTAMSADSHLVLARGGRSIIGLGQKPGETVLVGGGESGAKRILKLTGYSDYYATASNLTFTGGWAVGGGGGAILGSGTTRVIDCIFTNNCCLAPNAYGGGAICYGRAEWCYFANNRAERKDSNCQSHGGALWCNTDHGINDGEDWQGAYDCVFSNNWARTQGGGTKGGTCVRCKYYDNNANIGGGSTSGILIGCEFAGNTTRDGDCGGAYCPKAVTNCVFRNNKTIYNYEVAGGLYTDGEIPVIGCTFVGNVGYKSGGGLRCSGGLISNCLFKCNMCRNGSEGGGGGLYAASPSASFRVVDCVFEGNVANYIGGGALAPGGFVNCTFLTNQCAYGGGGVYADAKSKCGGFTGCTFTSNRTTTWKDCHGGGGFMSSSDDNRTVLTDCVFNDNRSATYGTAAVRANLRGCVVTNHLVGSYVLLSCNLNGCTIADNYCAEGNGVSCDAFRSDYGGDKAYTNANCVFIRNHVNWSYISNGKTVINCTYLDNVGDSFNYACVVPDNFPVYNSVFAGNKIAGSPLDFRVAKVPTMYNSTYATSDGDLTKSVKCTDCFQVSRDGLKFTKTHADDRPYEPRHSSPIVDKGYEADWLLAAVGGKDVYGNPRVMFDRLDIGSAECQEMGPGFMLFLR